MTRKHSIAMAANIASMEDRKAAACVAENFALIARQTNPRFDRARFMRACGVTATESGEHH